MANLMTIEEAKNSGFMARMNGEERVVLRSKDYERMLENRKDFVKLMKAWTQGWDEANLEYARTKINS